ncbi:hedgehog-interacting protein isoform X1 [Stegostoma tigrinum]|uniref:hedgehog-interacting protein isoform X1 n=1 Tax=Stegostoma tigrinum TaxID=3053191 RepID=UPI00202B91FB|nr:hedgehog-interacting protein isoform X1 [Stegostoma tigrinum]
MKMNAKVSLTFALVLAVAANFLDSEAKLRESEKSPVRRCLDGSAPRRLKKRDRRLLALDANGYICHKLYSRLSCCPRNRHFPQFLDSEVFSVTNNTECARLLEEIKCAECSPHAQNLFHISGQEGTPANELTFPKLCRDYCEQFYFACRSHMAGLFQITSDEFCNLYSAKDNGICFPDSPRKQVQGPGSNYLNQMDEYHKMDHINRKHKRNCYCLHEMISGLRQPTGLVHCGDGSQRLFVLEKEGFVKIFTPDGELLKDTFLDIHKQVQSGIKGGDERGLLSLAFHPKYKKNGKLYASYTTNQERWAIGPHDHILRVVEYTVSRKNTNQVDTRTAKVLIEVAELHRKHLGGQLLFGPDGFLYIFLGDGMITLDDMEEMDGLSDFTGSVLRIDVDTDTCNAPYAIPRSNPYFNSTSQPPEIFAHGLHNPGRCTVDQHLADSNGNLTILCSESNTWNKSSGRIIRITRGKDYETEPPAVEFKSSGHSPLVGGFIYRGCQSRRLFGNYIFGDRNGQLMSLQQNPLNKLWQERTLCLGTSTACENSLSGHISRTLLGFGEDELGEVYILASSKSVTEAHSGKVYKLIDPKRANVPEECKRSVQPPQPVASECSHLCRNGHCTPTGKCCCSPGWEGEFCRVAKCDPVCQHGGVCVRPNVCLCKESYTGPQCELVDRNTERVARAAACQQPRKHGNCNAPVRRWFFNADTRLCEQFLYRGCQGNKNRFSSYEECVKTCLPRSQQGSGLIQGINK